MCFERKRHVTNKDRINALKSVNYEKAGATVDARNKWMEYRTNGGDLPFAEWRKQQSG